MPYGFASSKAPTTRNARWVVGLLSPNAPVPLDSRTCNFKVLNEALQKASLPNPAELVTSTSAAKPQIQDSDFLLRVEASCLQEPEPSILGTRRAEARHDVLRKAAAVCFVSLRSKRSWFVVQTFRACSLDSNAVYVSLYCRRTFF